MARDVRKGSKADVTLLNIDVRFSPESGHCRAQLECLLWANSGHSPIKVMSEIRRLPLLRGSLTERVLFFDRSEGRTPSIVRLTPFSYLVGLPDVYRAFILIAHADRQTTSQGSELRPYNWDIPVEGERWQSRSSWRYSRRKKWEGLSSNSHWWSTLFGKSPCLALYDRQVAELRNQLYQR